MPEENLKKRKGGDGPTDSGLNPQQKAAATGPLGPLLIVAGAGTGKTTTLTARFAYLVGSEIAPKKICAITFTNKAAGEMRERVFRAEGLQAGDRKPLALGRGPFIGTFHSLGAKILRAECTRLGRKKNFAIFDDADSFALIKKIAKRMLKSAGGNAPADIKRLLQTPSFFRDRIAAIKNLGAERAVGALRREAEKELAARAYELYEHELKENNAFDFDDLIAKVVELLEKNRQVREKYQALFDAVLVDEYQDVNPKQYALVRLLAGKHKNISVVGDDEQMIYGWRYANLETFLNFERDWPGAAVALLEENYRSTRAIINSASALSKQNAQRRPKNLFTKNAEGSPIKVFEADNEVIEAAWIAAAARECRAAEPEASIAILYRTNAQSRAIEQALIRAEIPYIIYGGIKFYERKEVKDIVAALRFISNPQDSVSRERLEKNLSKAKFAGFMEALRAAKDLSPRKSIELFIKTADYMALLEREFLNFPERQENIAELISFASGFETLEELLEEISLVQATDAANGPKTGAPPISLMTIHLAKGLEFDAVFIAGAAEGMLPHARSMESESEIEEERRLMYVAMTRARKKLYISFYDQPSRFLGELPQEFLKFENLLSSDGGDDGWEEESVYI